MYFGFQIEKLFPKYNWYSVETTVSNFFWLFKFPLKETILKFYAFSKEEIFYGICIAELLTLANL